MKHAILLTATFALLGSPRVGATQPTSQPAEEHHHGEHHHGEGHNSDGMRHDFSDAEFWSSRFDAPERDEWQRPEHVVELLDLNAGMTVADIGAGTGYFEGYLSRAVGDGGQVLALDVEQTLVDFMSARATREGWTNVEARVVPYDDPQLEPGGVDRILVVDTWHHIGNRVAYTGLMRESLRDGGSVYVVDFTLETERGPPREHRLSAEHVASELREGGLEATILEEELPDQYVVVGRRP